jgi:hypothetical protein
LAPAHWLAAACVRAAPHRPHQIGTHAAYELRCGASLVVDVSYVKVRRGTGRGRTARVYRGATEQRRGVVETGGVG